MITELNRILNKIDDKQLREKITNVINTSEFKIGGNVYSGLQLEESPAGLKRHHSYYGGLVEHIIASSKIALTLCDVVEKVYNSHVNRDLVVTGIILHDIMKPQIYEATNEGYSSTPLGEYIDHTTLITAELMRRDFPLNIIHIVCAHHGGYAGSIYPKTLEALICHLADQADSQLNGKVLQAAKYLTRKLTGEELKITTPSEAFEIVNSKANEGWSGLNKILGKIKRKRDEL